MDPSRRIYVLGLGSIGRLIAYGLRTAPDVPSISVILRNETQAANFTSAGSTIGVITRDDAGTIQTDYASGFEAIALPRCRGRDIRDLVVCTKSTQVVSALSALKESISVRSNILLLQNGMGIHGELAKLWPLGEENERPSIYIGINTHGCTMPPESGECLVEHRGVGTIEIAKMLWDTITSQPNDEKGDDDTYMLTELTKSSLLHANCVSCTDVLKAQIDKMIVNCCINPLTAFYNVPNGAVATSPQLRNASALVIAEAVAVLSQIPELRNQLSDAARKVIFNSARLREVVLAVAMTTRFNVSSMRADVLAQRGVSEIANLNGYIREAGERLGIDTPANSVLADAIEVLASGEMASERRAIVESVLGIDCSALDRELYHDCI
ncbi:ketopantoate reductase PanE/ApbA C terminal-domain-containing protein [Limtongia smithiae]|uniref:ketopantoate reductase PanE/ApbA C terminal-domain-containing protein n=1 Tax=Limtongia smithiae TaxID=1125753 RepID=UPI0034CDB802